MQQSMFNGRISYFLCVLDSMGEIYKDNGCLSLRHKSKDKVMTVMHVK